MGEHLRLSLNNTDGQHREDVRLNLLRPHAPSQAPVAGSGGGRTRPSRSPMMPTTDRIVCHCLRVTEMEIRGAISTGEVETLRDVVNCTGAGGGCTCCHRRIRDLIAQSRAAAAAADCMAATTDRVA